MLRDIDRKMLAILRNYMAIHKTAPGFKLLAAKTGKMENEIKHVLNRLREAGYIEWDGKYTLTIAVLQAWGPRAPAPALPNMLD
ncbi:hypothetical protein ABE504_25140 [Paenibacillus oryzisoli]|uniref:hypothetical protein n=1 Tax=Paenibacillus oryzisoli TaxID=1850517 RepID=UPI003D2C6784